jgi:predicted Zn-ribbon and HTH transcriptional regulator
MNISNATTTKTITYDPLASLLNEFKDYKVMTLLECTSCGYTLERAYKEKEYVNKIVDDACPKCNSKMYIKAIYVIKEEKKQQKKGLFTKMPSSAIKSEVYHFLSQIATLIRNLKIFNQFQ